jgi:hypothetical protein
MTYLKYDHKENSIIVSAYMKYAVLVSTDAALVTRSATSGSTVYGSVGLMSRSCASVMDNVALGQVLTGGYFGFSLKLLLHK